MTSTEDNKVIARRLLSVRQLLGQTQKAFAESLYISLRALQNYEQGERKIPAEVLITLARVHSIDPVWVMDGPGKSPRMLAIAEDIDVELLQRAQSMVSRALEESKKKIDQESYFRLVAETYRFYACGAAVDSQTAFLSAIFKEVI